MQLKKSKIINVNVTIIEKQNHKIQISTSKTFKTCGLLYAFFIDDGYFDLYAIRNLNKTVFYH